MSSFRSLTFLMKPRFFTVVCMCSLFVAAGFKTASPQESLRKVVYGPAPAKETKTTPAPKKADPPKKTSAKASSNTKKAGGGGTAKKTTVARRPLNRPGWINVTFESKDPKTLIFVNDHHVGETDENRTFLRSMTPGTYRVKAVFGPNVVFPEKVVRLEKDGTKITLQEEVAKAPPKEEVKPWVIPKTQAEIEMELAREMSVKVIQIFSDYLDPQKSAGVTTDDWRYAASAAILGQFQNLSSQQIEAQKRFAEGKVSLAERNPQKAFTDFRLAVQSFPGSPLPHIGLGDAYASLSQLEDARRSYEQARSVGPKLWMPHRRLGDIYRELGEEKKAVASYADAIKFGDNTYETRFLRARTLVDAENVDAAVPLLEELLKEDPRSEIHVALGEAYEMSKRDVGALDHYRKAVELDPKSAAAQYRLARIYFEQREYEKAVEGFDKALQLDGDSKSFNHEDATEKRSAAISRIKPPSR